jgi:hypothetical protein
MGKIMGNEKKSSRIVIPYHDWDIINKKFEYLFSKCIICGIKYCEFVNPKINFKFLSCDEYILKSIL